MALGKLILCYLARAADRFRVSVHQRDVDGYPTRLGVFGANDARRFAPFLLMSILLHAVVIGTIRPPRNVAFTSIPTLDVRLAPAQLRQEDIETGSSSENPGKDAGATPRLKTRHGVSIIHPPPRLDDSHKVDLPKNVVNPMPGSLEKPPDSAFSPPRFSLESLRDSVRRIARDEARHLPPSKGAEGQFVDRPVLPELAHALARKEASVTQLADGIVKVVTSSGSVYCLQPPPVFAQGGPAQSLGTVSTCP